MEIATIHEPAGRPERTIFYITMVQASPPPAAKLDRSNTDTNLTAFGALTENISHNTQLYQSLAKVFLHGTMAELEDTSPDGTLAVKLAGTDHTTQCGCIGTTDRQGSIWIPRHAGRQFHHHDDHYRRPEELGRPQQHATGVKPGVPQEHRKHNNNRTIDPSHHNSTSHITSIFQLAEQAHQRAAQARFNSDTTACSINDGPQPVDHSINARSAQNNTANTTGQQQMERGLRLRQLAATRPKPTTQRYMESMARSNNTTNTTMDDNISIQGTNIWPATTTTTSGATTKKTRNGRPPQQRPTVGSEHRQLEGLSTSTTTTTRYFRDHQRIYGHSARPEGISLGPCPWKLYPNGTFHQRDNQGPRDAFQICGHQPGRFR